MYCNKCGKYIESDETLCPECKQVQQNVSTPNVVVIEQQATPITYAAAPSNKPGVISLVLSMVGLVGIFIAAFSIGFESVGLMVFASAVVITGFVISLVQGIKAIKSFIYTCKNKLKKPIAGFIMGIVGLETSAIVILYWFILAVSFAAM